MDETNPRKETSDSTSKAIGIGTWSLAMGVLSLLLLAPSLFSPYLLSADGLVLLLFLLSIFAAITGAICGLVALRQTRRLMTCVGLAISCIGMVLVILAGRTAFDDDNPPRIAAKAAICINNLRQIYNAKQEWAFQNKKQPTDIPTGQELVPYLPRGMGKCPLGGIYMINAVGQSPSCSISNHVFLPD